LVYANLGMKNRRRASEMRRRGSGANSRASARFHRVGGGSSGYFNDFADPHRVFQSLLNTTHSNTSSCLLIPLFRNSVRTTRPWKVRVWRSVPLRCAFAAIQSNVPIDSIFHDADTIILCIIEVDFARWCAHILTSAVEGGGRIQVLSRGL
jgi:hypothetical protein